MFARHQPLISAYARACPGNFARVTLVAILSARKPFYRLRDDMAKVDAGDWSPLFAWKALAFDDAISQAQQRHATLEALWPDDLAMLVEVSRWYGLGFVKGGFVLQMAYGVAGCLDVRNAADFGLLPSDIRAPSAKASPKVRENAARRYLALCAKLGGTSHLWNYWCEGYSEGGMVPGWQVSAEHCRLLGIDPGKPEDDEIPF